MDEGVRAEIILLSVLAVSILLMLSNFGMGGVIGQAVCDFFFGLFGVTEWAAPVLIFSWNSILHSKQTELFNCAENRGSDQLLRLFLRFYAASGVRLYERYDISGLLF